MSGSFGEAALIVGLVVAIGVAVWLKARQTIRREAGRPRGIAPGEGDHIIDVEYSSGFGGGHASQIRVPRDPQAYARRFVPRGAGASGTGRKRDQDRAQAGGRQERERDET